MSWRRFGRRRIEWCRVCMCPATVCTCGWRGSPVAPGADRGGEMHRAKLAEPPEPAPPAPGEFSFETIDEYRDDGA